MPRSPKLSPMCNLPNSDTSDSLVLIDQTPEIIVTPAPMNIYDCVSRDLPTTSLGFSSNERDSSASLISLLKTKSANLSGNATGESTAQSQRLTRVTWRDLLSTNSSQNPDETQNEAPINSSQLREECNSIPSPFKGRGRLNALIRQGDSSFSDNTRVIGVACESPTTVDNPRRWWKSALHWVRQEKTGMHLYEDDLLERVEHDTRAYMQELEEEDDEPVMPQANRQPRFSTVAMNILRAKEDRDIHPFGRGGRFEGVLYGERKVTVQLDHTKFLAWMFFVGFLLFVSIAIIVLAELDRASQQSLESR